MLLSECESDDIHHYHTLHIHSSERSNDHPTIRSPALPPKLRVPTETLKEREIRLSIWSKVSKLFMQFLTFCNRQAHVPPVTTEIKDNTLK